MKQYHKNPRQITKRQYDQLDEWLRELGDLSGIVHDLNTDEIIGGNQRSRVFDIDHCEIELTDGPHEPDAQGTVAHGFILWQGNRYAYRQVRWTEKQCEQANIVANKAGGGWDFDLLANGFEVGDLLEWGFEAGELGMAATGDEWGDAMGNLPDEDRAPFQQMTFTLHDDQAELVKDALALMKKLDDFAGSPNENSNGNALAAICEIFLGMPENGTG